MGNRINLVRMGLAPATVNCPNCGHVVDPRFYEHDIECEFPMPLPGVLSLGCYCPDCEHEWQWEAKVVVEQPREGDRVDPWQHSDCEMDIRWFERVGEELQTPIAASEGHRNTIHAARRLWDEAVRLRRQRYGGK